MLDLEKSLPVSKQPRREVARSKAENEQFVLQNKKITPKGALGRTFDSETKKKMAKLKLKLASLGEQNMTYQNSKKIKIHKKKHPEVRKAQSNSVEDILRGLGRSVDSSHHQSTFLSTKGDFIGGGDIHDMQVSKATGNKIFGETATNDFLKQHGLARVQNFPINRAGEKRISVGINSRMNPTQLKSIKDLEIGGHDVGFVVGSGKEAVTGRSHRDLMSVLKKRKLL